MRSENSSAFGSVYPGFTPAVIIPLIFPDFSSEIVFKSSESLPLVN